MKFGLLIEEKTRNIGDDIQAYVTRRFLPRVDYYVDRNHIDEFVPNTEEKVALIANGWFLQYTLNWPPSPYLKILPISMHFTNKDWFWDTTDRPYHLQGYGLKYLKTIEPIGCRDSHTQKLLTEKGIKTEYTGCMTLTLQKFEGIEKKDYICAVDVSDAVVDQIRKTTDMEVKVMTHTVPEDYYKLSWDERMEKVEELLKIYQGARAVVSYRLHCALPCLSLETPVILLNEEYRNDRFGDYTAYMESCSEDDFLSGKIKYDYRNLPKHSEEWKNLRKDLISRCKKFVKLMEEKDEKYDDDINIKDYKEYVINKSNWLKDACLESYNRFEEEKANSKKIKEDLNIEKENSIKKDEKIKKQEEEIQIARDSEKYYHKEFDECLEKMENYKKELESIKASRWWKMRQIVKKDNK